MSDDFGTISARRGDRAKEIDVLRKHRESLVQMLADVDQQLKELEIFDTPAARPLVTTPDYEEPLAEQPQPGGGARVLLILGAALLALVLIGWLIWRASSDRPVMPTSTAVVEDTATETETTATAPATIAETVPSNALVVTPPTRDYGLVRKGTRVTRQYEIANNTEEPISINIARSVCRCLYDEHAPVIPPKAKETLTVTVDGAKAKAGELRETLKITRKNNPAVATTAEVRATVQ